MLRIVRSSKLLWGAALIGLVAIGLFAPAWFNRWREGAFRRQCQALRAAKQWEKLDTASAKWAEWRPSDGEPWLFRAEAAEGRKQLEDVVGFLGRVPVSDRRALGAYLERARLLFEVLDRPREAVETYERVLEIDARVSIAHRRAISFYALTLQRSAMIRRIREAMAVGREPPEAYIYLVGAHWLLFGNLYELNSRWLLHDPEFEPYVVARAIQVIESTAANRTEQGNRFKDCPSADDLLRLYPKNLEAIALHLERGIEDGDQDRVAALINSAPESSSNDYRFWRARGWCHFAAGRLEQAESAYLRALEIDHFGWKVQHHLADVYRQLGRVEKVSACEEKYRQGKKIHDAITQIPDASSAPKELLQQIAVYAGECGDHQVAVLLSKRLED